MDTKPDLQELATELHIYRTLARLSADDQGIEAIARALADFTHKAVLIQDKRLFYLAQLPTPDLPNWQDIVEALGGTDYLPPELADRKQAHTVTEPLLQVFETCARLILPVVTRDVARGYVSLVARRSDFGAADRIAVEQGALVVAIEMAKVKAVSVAEKKLRGDLIQAVLTRAITEADAMSWAERGGFRKTGPFVVLTMQWVGSDAPSLRRLETIVNGQLKRQRGRIIEIARENELVVLYAVGADKGDAEAERWAESIQALARGEFPRAHLAIGIGRQVSQFLGARDSYREASQAMLLEHRLRHQHPQVFAKLGVYRLLLPLAETPELRAFADEVLGNLLKYNRQDKGNLIETLRMYFRCNGNAVQTARALYIHRHTLLYRLERISSIGALDLDDPETRLEVQLALRAYELTRKPDEK